MTKSKVPRRFPPDALSDLSTSSASAFMKLLDTLDANEFALVLGAGVSSSAGLPAWPQLLSKLCAAFFSHWEFDCENGRATIDRPPRNLSIAFANEVFWSSDAVLTAEAFIAGEPLLVAQQIKNCLRPADWKWLLRRALYDIDDLVQHDGSPSELIRKLSRLCARREGRIRAILSYNYDDLLELCLKSDHVQHTPVYSRPIGNSTALPVFHPHGFLPLHGGPADTTFVLAEEDYMQHACQPFSWSNLVQLEIFSKFPCIFIGTAMKDTALRRLLRLSRTIQTPSHFAFLPVSDPKCSQSTMFDALFDYDLHGLGVSVIRYKTEESAVDRHERLLSLLDMLIACSDDRRIIWDIERA